MRCEFIEECPYAEEYVGNICLYKAELCGTRRKFLLVKQTGWKIKILRLNRGKGFLIEGPRGRRIYLAPKAPKRERELIIQSLPEYVKQLLKMLEAYVS